MKSLSVQDLDRLAESLQPLVGSRFQEVYSSETDLVLGFYSHGQMQWLWIDLNPRAPLLVPLERLPMKPKKQTPTLLFLKANALDLRLESISRPPDLGRVLQFELLAKEGKTVKIELRLFPHGQNCIVSTGAKKISWHKPKDLVSSEELTEKSFPQTDFVLWREAWLQARFGKRSKGADPKSIESALEKNAAIEKIAIEKQLKKTQKAFDQLKKTIEDYRAQTWRVAAEWISTHQSLQVPSDLRIYVDGKRALAWNVQNCFEEAKKLEAKISGGEKRLEILATQIEKLQQGIPLSPHVKSAEVKGKPEKAPRGWSLGEGISAEWGKNGKQNLEILRRAKAWDIWLHVKDYPGSHGVIHRSKGQKISDKILRQIGQKLLEVSVGKKRLQAGDRFELLVAECRFVKPIAGDRLGRVHYREERVISLQYEEI